MTVAELIKELRKQPPRSVVYLMDPDGAGGTALTSVTIQTHFDAVSIHLA